MIIIHIEGDDILVAPMVTEGYYRDIYLPKGFWKDQLRRISWTGPYWLRHYNIKDHEVRPAASLILVMMGETNQGSKTIYLNKNIKTMCTKK